MVDAAPVPGSLAGRDQELAALRGWRAEALAGGGRLVVLTGPPGIGKTRLAEELAGSARRDGQRVLWGRAVEERGAPPLWPWRRILNAVGVGEEDHLVGDRSSGGVRSEDLAAARFLAAAAAADAVTGAARAADLLVVLEDLQWADHASLFLLREVAAELPGSRLLVLATCRDTAVDPWRTSIADLARLPGVQILRLASLSESAVAGMLRAVGVTTDPELARFVHARSEGNPLYVTTLARVLAAQPGAAADPDAVVRIAAGSAEVSHLVASLLRGLDQGACALLAAASVLGADFDSGLAAAVAGTGQDAGVALSAAETCGLVTRQPDRPGSWWFTHALVRDGIYASLGGDQRIALHAAAAAALEPLAAHAPERGGEIAAHLLRGAPDPSTLLRAAGWAATAAAAATSALAFEDAVRYLATALTAAESADVGGAERAELLIELATAEYRAGQLAASLRHAVAAADTAERDGRLDLVAGAALVVRGIGHTPVAVTLLGLCDRALADDGCPPALRARLLAQRASALAELGDLEAAAAGSAAAMAAAAAVGDPAAELDAIRARVAALSAPQHRAERLRLGTRAVELAAPAGQPLAAVLGRVWRIDAAYQLLNLEAVDAEIAQIAQLAESTRLPLARWHLLRQQASRAALAGQLDIARDRSNEARRLAFRIQDPSGAGLSYVFAVWLAVLRGDAREIPADFFDAAAAAPPIPIVRAPLARALFAVGRTDEAQAVYETLRHLPAAGDKDIRTLGALTQLMDLIIAFRDSEMAQATYDLIHSHVNDSGATGTGLVFLSGSAHWPLGRLAALVGRTEDALGHFAAAVTIDTRLGARPLVTLTRLDWAGSLRTRAARGDYPQARLLAWQAAAEARRLDMPGPAGRAEQLVNDLDQAIRSGDPLTPREREIAGLVSAGITNLAIATQLVLSERTVEGHVRSILAKLQLTNRTELAAWTLRNPGS
jgi:DNA-binding CsgD family transcriptional regulator/nucleoside-triphosphatase THEP1